MVSANYQWGIFWVNLDPTKGSEQSGTRPVLVVSIEAVNKALPVVTVLSITSLKAGRKIYPTEVLLKKELTGLEKDSIAMVHQVRSISKERLGIKCGEIKDEKTKSEINKGLKLYFNL